MILEKPQRCAIKVLITGGSGYIGRATANYLNCEVTLVDLHNDFNDPCLHITDLTNYRELERVFEIERPNVVLHLAGYKSVPESKTHPTKYYYNNLVSSLNLINICEKLNIPMVFASTAAIYYEETPYSKSKLIIEEALANSKVNHIILRYFNVGGLLEPATPRQSGNVFDVIRLTASVGKLFMVHKGSATRDYTHIYDLACVNAQALKMVCEGITLKTYDVLSGNSYSLDNLLRLYEQEGNPINFQYVDSTQELQVSLELKPFPYTHSLGIEDIVKSEIKHGLTSPTFLEPTC